MNVGEIFDHSFKLFKAQFKSYLAIMAVGTVCLIGTVIIIAAAYFAGGPTPAIVSGVVFGVLLIAVNLAMAGALVMKISEQIFNRNISLVEAFRYGFSRALSLFFGCLLMFFVCSIGFILLIIPGIYLATLGSFILQVILIEGKGPGGAMMRSRELVKGYWWRTFGILILLNILISVLASVAALPLALAGWGLSGDLNILQAVNNIVKLLMSFLLYPLSLIATTLLYYDLRIRKEHLDIQQMVDNLTAPNSGNLSG